MTKTKDQYKTEELLPPRSINESRCQCAELMRKAGTYHNFEPGNCPVHRNFDRQRVRLSDSDMTISRQLPALVDVSDLPQFTVQDRVVVYGIENTENPVKCAIFSDKTFYSEGTYAIQLNDGTIYENVPASKIDVASTTYKTPRSTIHLASKLIRPIKSNSLKSVLLTPPVQVDRRIITEMLSKYTKLIELNYESEKNIAIIFIRRSVLYASIGNNAASLSDAESALSRDPRLSVGYFRKGFAHFAMKNYDRAAEAFQKGLEFNPGNANLRHALDESMSESRCPTQSRRNSMVGSLSSSLRST